MTENFKGIEFVRISSLPEEIRQKVWNSFQQDKIIKIVKDHDVLTDCILYKDYVSWLDQGQVRSSKPSTQVSSIQEAFSKLVFK
jgi:hypothetical protein